VCAILVRDKSHQLEVFVSEYIYIFFRDVQLFVLHVEEIASSSANSVSQVKGDFVQWLPLVGAGKDLPPEVGLEVRGVGVSLNNLTKLLRSCILSICYATQRD